jgi:hypothetical protein
MRDSERGVGLVERAVGGDPQIVFLAPLAGAQSRRAVVAGTGVDLVEDDHRWLRQYQSLPGVYFAKRLFAHRPDRDHDDYDGDELEQNPPPHQLLRRIARTTAHHVGEAQQQNYRDGADGDRNESVRQEICHEAACSPD